MSYFDPSEPIHITVPCSPDDPRRQQPPPPGVIIHYGPPMHPDDLDVIDGLPVTSLARTLIDSAEYLTRDEVVGLFCQAHARGILDMDAVHASRARVEWRPSLAMLDEVIALFDAALGS